MCNLTQNKCVKHIANNKTDITYIYLLYTYMVSSYPETHYSRDVSQESDVREIVLPRV